LNQKPEKRRDLTQEKIKEYLHYNPVSGVFTWIKNKGRAKKGDECSTKDKLGYYRIFFDRRGYGLHEIAHLYMTGKFAKGHVDHIDRNPSNNKWENLRDASYVTSGRNKGLSKRNKSNIVGVYKHTNGKWCATLRVNGISKYFGIYKKKVDAVIARRLGEIKYNYDADNAYSTAHSFLKVLGIWLERKILINKLMY
jgi:hypothetical protein